MIELEALKDGDLLARVHKGDTPAAGFPAVFVISPSADGTEAMIKGLHGRMDRKGWREMLQILIDLNVKTLLSLRKDGHSVPLGTVGDDGITRTSVAELAERFQAPNAATDWAPL